MDGRSTGSLGGSTEMLYFLYVAILPTAALVAALSLATVHPKRRVTIHVAIAVLAPLFVLFAYLINGYHRHWDFWPFQYGSLVPHLLAATLSLALLVAALIRALGSTRAKVLVGSLAATTWLGLWLCGSLAVACFMGDCL